LLILFFYNHLIVKGFRWCSLHRGTRRILAHSFNIYLFPPFIMQRWLRHRPSSFIFSFSRRDSPAATNITPLL